MRRRAYVIFAGNHEVKINTTFKAQQNFNLKNLRHNQGIDLITLKVVDNPNTLPFYLRVFNEESMDLWELHRLQDSGIDVDFERIENAPFTAVVEGLVDAYGSKEMIGYITRGETKSFEVFIP